MRDGQALADKSCECSHGRDKVSIIAEEISTCVPVADYRNSGKTKTANSNVKQTAKILQFPTRNVSRKATVRVGWKSAQKLAA